MRDDRVAMVRDAGQSLRPALQHLLAVIADVEADGWDTDWIRLPKRYATAVLTDIEAELVGPGTWHAAAQHAELLGSELALRRWVSSGEPISPFGSAAEVLLTQLESYRRVVRALGSDAAAT